MNRGEIQKLLWKPYNLDILELGDGERSILDISRIIGLTYKSVFLKIGELKRAGIINVETSELIGEATRISINKGSEFYKFIEAELDLYNLAKNDFKRFMKEKENQTGVLNLLDVLRKKRFIERDELFLLWPKKTKQFYDQLEFMLRKSGIIKERLEITRKGINILEKRNGIN